MDLNLPGALHDAGLTGRGGSAFSTAIKLKGARLNRAELIINGCDGEIGAAKDTHVLLSRLDEVAHGAALTGLRNITYAVHSGSDAEAHLRSHRKRVLAVPRRYVSSEASALVALHNGRPARPMTKRSRLVEGARTPDGRKTRPALVLNAETLLRISEIQRFGAPWFRSFGTRDEPGPRLVSITGAVAQSGVYETQAGVPLPEVLDLAGFRPHGSPGVNIGGLGGTWLGMHQVPTLNFSDASLAAAGARIGPGVIAVHGPATCPVDTVAQMLAYAAGESAGQCGPCMFGVPSVAERFRSLVKGTAGTGDSAELRKHLTLLRGRGACHFPDGIAAFTDSALTVFADHLALHSDSGGCPLTGPGVKA